MGGGGGAVYAIQIKYSHIQHIQGCGASSVGLKYAIYCHKQSIQLQWGFVKAIKSHIQLYAAYTGLWGLLCASVYHIYTIQGHIEHIQEDEETSGRLYLQYTPYTTVHSIHRALGPPRWVSMSHKKNPAYTGIWGLLCGTVYVIHCHM